MAQAVQRYLSIEGIDNHWHEGTVELCSHPRGGVHDNARDI